MLRVERPALQDGKRRQIRLEVFPSGRLKSQSKWCGQAAIFYIFVIPV